MKNSYIFDLNKTEANKRKRRGREKKDLSKVEIRNVPVMRLENKSLCAFSRTNNLNLHS